MLTVHSANGSSKRFVHTLQVFAVGHAGDHQFRVVVRVACPGLVNELVAENSRLTAPDLGQCRPVRCPAVAQSVDVVVEVLRG